MDRVICDVCSMDYAATEAQCPICGCARAGARQTSAGNTASQEDGAYTPVKGGRFSKTNVRKRLKAAQIQPVPVEIPSRVEKIQEPEQEPDENYDDEDETDDVEEPVSNRGLILIVALLLAAIVAVSCYIAIGVFKVFDFASCEGSGTVTTSPVGTTAPVLPPENRIPCTGLTVDSKITLVEQGCTMTLSFSVDPIDTTDTLEFVSSDPAVATVDQQGRVTAVDNGEANITVTCGDFTQTCQVSCVLDGQQPDVPDVPDEPMPNLQMRSEYNDVSFPAKGYQWRAYKETDDFGPEEAAKFTWKMDDESIATVDNGYITTVAPGRTTLRVFYGDEQVGYCLIRCNWTEEEKPEEPETPEDPENPDDPAVPGEEYSLKINNVTHPFKYNGKENSADVTINLNSNVKSFKLTIVNKDGAIMNDVVWTLSKDGICSVSNNTVKGLSEGNCTITAEYEGVTFLVYVRCTA